MKWQKRENLTFADKTPTGIKRESKKMAAFFKKAAGF